MTTRAAKKRERRGRRNVNLWLASSLLDALDEAVAAVEPRTTKTALLEVIIREHLEREGRWPPRGGKEAGDDRQGRA